MPNIIITGGPGSGKSTLLEELKKLRFSCVPEASRQLIQQQVSLATDCLPWKNLACFARLSLDKMASDFEAVDRQQINFFDRGIPDIIAYLKVGNLNIPSVYHEYAKALKYFSTVFVAPPWREIYVNDNERWQTFEQACLLHETIESVYSQLGYKLIEIPCSSIEERAEFILDKIGKGNLSGPTAQLFHP